MSRSRWIVLGALVLLLALLPLLPHRAADVGAVRTTTAETRPGHLTAGYGRVTPAFRRTIDRVVAAGAAAGATAGRTSLQGASARTIVDEVVRCATFEGQRYCLGTGWTDRTQAQVQDRALALLQRPAARRSIVTTTGDLSTYDALRRAARMSPTARADAERAELTRAARSVAKVWLIRHQFQGVPLPHGFLARHPEVHTTTATTASTTTTTTTTTTETTATTGDGVDSVSGPRTSERRRVKPFRDYPDRGVVLSPKRVSEQHRTYWCGPTTMQMIVWGWTHTKASQYHWAKRLGTTTDGTAITQMVRVVNQATGYDRASRAGPYITLDISDWSYKQWRLLMARHVVDYRAPVVLHPVLLKRYFPYLDHDGSGHFQVGRGYRKRDGKPTLLSYFEPWNQQRFHPDEPYIDRVQWRNAYRSYRANEAHFQHNLGV